MALENKSPSSQQPDCRRVNGDRMSRSVQVAQNGNFAAPDAVEIAMEGLEDCDVTTREVFPSILNQLLRLFPSANER